MLFLVGNATVSFAQSEARTQLEATIGEVLVELQKPGLKQAGTRDVVMGNVERIIGTLFDYEELSARTVGPKWRTFTADQKKRFLEAFTSLLREAYLEKLEGYSGETVNYLSEEVTPDGSKVRIQTTVLIKNKNVPVTYSMIKKAKWVVYDVTIEGVSMVQNYRSQFNEVLLKNDIELLIKQVNQKALTLRAHNKSQQMS